MPSAGVFLRKHEVLFKACANLGEAQGQFSAKSCLIYAPIYCEKSLFSITQLFPIYFLTSFSSLFQNVYAQTFSY